MAIIIVHYILRLRLSNEGLRPKSSDFYKLNKDKFVGFEIDFEWFLLNLEQGNKYDDLTANKYLFVQKK